MGEQEITVSIFCTVYNHEKYLRKCLDGFVSQKTDFKYEVIVHDDASTDLSPKIIEEYYKKYPDIFVPVIQKQNQCSQKIAIADDILFPLSKGKYIALCEGDDYWCNKYKLQKQYEYMENHSECLCCLHNTINHDVSGKKKDRLFNNWKDIHKMNESEIFFGWNVHTSSYFIRREYMQKPEFGKHFWSGDYVMLTWIFTKGSIVCLPQVMSVYNARIPSGITMQNLNSSLNKLAERTSARIEYLQNLRKNIPDSKYTNIINQRIQEDSFEVLRLQKMNQILLSTNKKDAISACKSITTDSRYKLFLKKQKGIKFFITLFKYHGYIVYSLWIFILRHYYKSGGNVKTN